MKLALRDAIWIAAILLLAGGWWIDHRAQGAKNEDLRQAWRDSLPKPDPHRERVEAENTRLRNELDELISQE